MGTERESEPTPPTAPLALSQLASHPETSGFMLENTTPVVCSTARILFQTARLGQNTQNSCYVLGPEGQHVSWGKAGNTSFGAGMCSRWDQMSGVDTSQSIPSSPEGISVLCYLSLQTWPLSPTSWGFCVFLHGLNHFNHCSLGEHVWLCPSPGHRLKQCQKLAILSPRS